jgi:hypothetical protein
MLFQFYGDKEIDVLKNHSFQSDLQDQEKLLCEWRSFKFELIELRKKWLHFKDQVIANKLKLKYTATEWVLCQVWGQFQEEFIHVVAIATEHGGSAIKRIKARSRFLVLPGKYYLIFMHCFEISLNSLFCASAVYTY